MKEKIKDYVNAILLVIIAILGSIIYAVSNKASKLASKNGQLESDKNLADIIQKKDEAENEATAKENEYNRVRDLYNAQSSDGAGGDA